MAKNLSKLRCGAGTFETGKWDPMTNACIAHDLDYIEGGTDEQREEADCNFEKNCEFIAKENKTFASWFLSKLYPRIVFWKGKDFWKEESRLKEYLKEREK